MALKQSSEALRRPPKFLWLGLPLLTLISLILGYVGLRQFVLGHSELNHGTVDIMYYDLQLFVLGSDPLQLTGPYPVSLDIARFCAPAVTVYAAVEAVRLLLAVELSRLRARRAQAHSIVCGDTAFADALTRRLRADGKDVVEIRTEVDEFVSPGEPLRIIGDARDAEVLRSAGIDRATSLYACTQDSAANLAIVLAVARTVAAEGQPLFTYSLISDPDLCAIVQAFFLGQPMSDRVRSDFFNIEHIAARRLFRDVQLDPVDGHPPRLLIAGTDGFAQALLIEAARSWRATHPKGRDALPVTLVGERAAEVVRELRDRFPVVEETCQVQSVEDDLLPLMQHGILAQAPDHVLVTYPDEEYALKSAMTAERHWPGRAGRITVRLDGALIGVPGANGNLGMASATLRVFGAVGAAADPELIRDDLTERIARVLHDRYLSGRRQRGDTRGGRALVSWDELPGRLRLANRSQAEDIGRKLARLGYAIIPRQAGQAAPQLSEAEIDELALMEHDRWCREQRGAGWRYAPDLDEQRQLHPGLLDWEELPAAMRLRNYDPIRELPTILADAGFQLVHT
jgi:voltage-gated potassium channel Kch